MPGTAQEALRGPLEVFDTHSRVGRQDAAEQHLDLAVIARVVLGHHGVQPFAVLFAGRLPGLAIAQRRIGLTHLGQSTQDEVRLDRQRLLAPQRAVVVEHRHALVDGDGNGPALAASLDDEFDDGPLCRTVDPHRQCVLDARRTIATRAHCVDLPLNGTRARKAAHPSQTMFDTVLSSITSIKWPHGTSRGSGSGNIAGDDVALVGSALAALAGAMACGPDAARAGQATAEAGTVRFADPAGANDRLSATLRPGRRFLAEPGGVECRLLRRR